MANKKSNVLTIRVPHDLKDRIEKTAHKQGVSMNQFAIYALAREISELETASFLRDQYGDKTPKEIYQNFDKIMNKISKKKRKPDWDKLDSQESDL